MLPHLMCDGGRSMLPRLPNGAESVPKQRVVLSHVYALYSVILFTFLLLSSAKMSCARSIRYLLGLRYIRPCLQLAPPI